MKKVLSTVAMLAAGTSAALLCHMPAQASSGRDIYLPFDPGQTLTITQGWNTDFTHGADKPAYRNSTYGLDFATNGRGGIGARATRAGRVHFAGPYGALGNTVIIRYVDGKYGFYGHLKSLWVTKGNNIVGGQGLGEIGASGRGANGVIHLHYEQKSGPNWSSPSRAIYFQEETGDLNGWVNRDVTSQNPDNRN